MHDVLHEVLCSVIFLVNHSYNRLPVCFLPFSPG